MHHYFSDLNEDISKIVRDPRRKKSSHYSLDEIILGCVMMYLFRVGSRHQMNVKREYKEFRINYARLLNLRLPHMDTVDTVMKMIEPSDMESLLEHMVKILLKKRVLHKFRLLGKWFKVAIDGTGVFTYSKEPYEGCPYKTSKNGKRTYHQPVVEAKLICDNGFSISMGSEWIINQDGQTKQDCEYKATMRLLDKLKTSFPRLPMCLLMDGLFVKHPIQERIKGYGWEFIMVWKDKTCWHLQDQVEQHRADQQLKSITYTNLITKNTREEYELEYLPQKLDHKGIAVYYLKGKKTQISITAQTENTETKFVFMTSIPVNTENVKRQFTAGRQRWKIENEGFNVQKNSGLALHHKMNTKNITAIKNYYSCLQIAHLISQLIT